MSATDTREHDEAEAGPSPSPIVRYDEFFDPRKRTTLYRKTNKSDLEKHLQKLKKKKPILVVRRVIDSKGRHTTTQVDVRSKKLAIILQDLYDGVEGLDISRNPPFCNDKLLYHSYSELKQLVKKERTSRTPDAELIHDLEVAMKFVQEDHASTYSDTQALLEGGDAPSITFDLLWALFRPGCLLYSYDEYTDQARVLKAQSYKIGVEGNQVYALVRSHMVAHDGKTFGTAVVSHKIYRFDGARKLQDLAVYPLDHYPEQEELRARAAARGRRFVSLLKHKYLEASGSAVHEIRKPDLDLERRRFTVHGRVMIDPTAFRQWQISVSSLINATVRYRLDPTKLTEEQYMLCTPIVLGFSFAAKQWGGFALDRLTEVDWSHKPFETLVMNSKTKKLVHSMVNQHSQGTSDFDDVVKGKGKGLIGLLCGPPGGGKTLTAEAVAEVTHCPLYCLSAGELGVKHEEVEQRLAQILELAHKWRAVVLLDEADVFLAQRDSIDVNRNALVSIFLRKLEYYQGILILTTNLISHCDIAFESRIHFTIHYPALESDSRQKIWKNFITLASESHIVTESEIDSLSKVPLNGRQIKNAVSVAQSFASGEGARLSIDHIYTVLDVMRDWQKAKEAMSPDLGVGQVGQVVIQQNRQGDVTTILTTALITGVVVALLSFFLLRFV